MQNEHIVGTGIYYYVSENITQSDLQSRTFPADPIHQQGDGRGVQLVYGLVDNQPLNQILGELITQADRCIVFPNILFS